MSKNTPLTQKSCCHLLAIVPSDETVEHYLLQCRRFSDQRHKMRRALARGSHLSMRSLLGDVRNHAAVLRYVQDTERFPLYTRVVANGAS